MTTKETWIKENLFSVINLVLIVATFSYNYGVSTNKFATAESNISDNRTNTTELRKVVDDLVQNGHPAHEARIAALEKKTDDLAVLKNIVQTQSENIRQLTETVRADHDILLRYVTAAENKPK